MTYKERQAFRKTDAWRKWKAKCRLHTTKDFITKEPLCRNWNLHHLDLNVQRYNHIDDMNRFMPLNPKTHELIHELFKWYKKDHKVIDRIKKTLDLMEEYTNGNYKSTCKEVDTDCNAAKTGETVHTQKDR
mgnify:CR=1 FL=1